MTFKGVKCKTLPSKDVKIWVEASEFQPYVLFNANDTKKRKDGTHEETAEILDVEYFIRFFPKVFFH